MPPIVADVIFPAFSAPYFSPLLFPVAGILAIGAEWFCYRRFSSDPIYPKLRDIILANLVSWVAGLLISFCLPSGLIAKTVGAGEGHGESHILTPGPHFGAYVIVAFFVACILSVIIEFWSLRLTTREHPVDGLLRLSTIANVAGYVVLGLVAWVWITWVW